MNLGPASDNDDAQGRALAQQWRGQHGPDEGPGLPVAGHGLRELRLGCPDVCDVDRSPVAHRSSGDVAANDG